MKTLKIIIYFLVDTTIGKIITAIIPSVVFYFGLFKEFNFTDYSINKMELSSAIIFGLIIWGLLFINTKLKYLKVKFKYFDIMLTKFHDQYKGHPCTVFPDDANLFSKDEKKYIDEYLEYQEKLGIIMKGKNKTFGTFK